MRILLILLLIGMYHKASAVYVRDFLISKLHSVAADQYISDETSEEDEPSFYVSAGEVVIEVPEGQDSAGF